MAVYKHCMSDGLILTVVVGLAGWLYYVGASSCASYLSGAAARRSGWFLCIDLTRKNMASIYNYTLGVAEGAATITTHVNAKVIL